MILTSLINANIPRLTKEEVAILKKYALDNSGSNFKPMKILTSPFFYLGLALGTAGVVVLKGEEGKDNAPGVK
jgi:hypothetical protein